MGIRIDEGVGILGFDVVNRLDEFCGQGLNLGIRGHMLDLCTTALQIFQQRGRDVSRLDRGCSWPCSVLAGVQSSGMQGEKTNQDHQ